MSSNQVALGAREKTLLVLELRPHFPLANLLRAAEMARSSFYYQLGALRKGDKHYDLKAKIRDGFNRHKGRYGYRRVTAELRQQGLIVNHKTV
ncbi:IS3 family transposase [Variovorax sp. H27-G14]|uniref:IS3 family transposase n=1 Tax=Variovorax sp. H27-G14 TaxID=3111914 RepID=UPI0038FCED5D